MSLARTHTRTHVEITFANPFLACLDCRQLVTGYHDSERCGCDGGFFVMPCEHKALSLSICPTWNPVDGCICLAYQGFVDHKLPR